MPRKKTIPGPGLTPTVPDLGGPIELSTEAKTLIADVSSRWDLTPPVSALLQLIGEALTKKQLCDEVTKREGLAVRDGKGAIKSHPCADLAYRYQATASAGLQRLISNLG